MENEKIILLVEDNPGDADLIQEFLSDSRLNIRYIEWVERLSEAMIFLKNTQVDLVLLDLNLPDSSGLESLYTLRKNNPETAVLVLTGFEDRKAGLEAMKAGAQDYLIKSSLSSEVLTRVVWYSIERHQSEKRLWESEKFLRASLDSLSAHIAILDENGVILMVNEAWRKFAEQNETNVAGVSEGANYIDVCENTEGKDAADAAAIADAIRSVQAGKCDNFEMEYPCHSPDVQRWFHAKITPLSYEKRGMAVISHENITSRVLAQEALKKSEALFRKVYDVLPVGLWISDKKGRLIQENPAGEKIWGASLLEKQDQYFVFKTRHLHSGKEMLLNDWSLLHTIKKGISISDELLEIEAFDGQKKLVISYTAPVFNDEQQVDGAIIVNNDVTELMQTREALRDSEVKLKEILDAMTSKVVLFDKELKVLWPNQEACKSADLTREKIIGRKCQHIWAASSPTLDNCAVLKAFHDGRPHTKIKKTPEGKTWRIIACPVRNDAGIIVSAVEVSEDISERVSMEDQLRQAQKMESLGTLAGGIAHDFNNILTAILGYTELAIDKSKGNEMLLDNLTEVHQAGIRATELVRQILTFSRRAETELQPLKIDLIIKEALKLLQSILPSSIAVRHNIHRELPPVLADPTQIHQIIMNLCTNASHAMEPDGGELRVTLEEVTIGDESILQFPELSPGVYLRLKISDTGCGMTPEIVNSIFDPYFTTKDLGEGTGLGLSVVHGIVNDCGGNISVQSAPGKGSVFILHFPALIETVKKEDSSPQAFSMHGGSERIMVVDDEPPVAKLISRTLEKLGYRTTVENDSTKALQLFRDHPDEFDLILTDMTMPKLTGDKLAVEIRRIRPHFPLILCTGYSKQITEEKALEIGISAMLFKPVTRHLLASEIRRVLNEAENHENKDIRGLKFEKKQNPAG